MATPAPRKSSKGRQKVAMVKMAKESNLQVTFSKRRTGLFKKASELCTLCASDVGLIVFSPGNKVFSFGHPSVDSVVDRYLSRSHRPHQGSSGALQLIDAHRNVAIQELNAHITQVANQLEEAKKVGESQASELHAERSACWWKKPVNDMDKAQLEQMSSGLDLLKKKVTRQADKILGSNNAGQLLGPANLNPNNNVGFYPQMSGFDPDEFEQKNILNAQYPPTPSMRHPHMMNMNVNMNMNMNMNMNNSTMAMMNGAMMSNSGYNIAHGGQFDHFQRGFF